MSCIPASHSMSTILSPVESQMEESPGQRRGSRAYQIFPEVNMNEDSDSLPYPDDFRYKRERLPSIVVEPTEPPEHGEESGELRWPPRLTGNNMEEEEEEDEDSSTDHTEASVDGDHQEELRRAEGSVARKSSLGPSQSQLSLSRLTPPTSPPTPEAAPPCRRS